MSFQYLSQPLDTESIPWIPIGPGESFKLLRCMPGDRGRVLLLRVDPGTVISRHRHLADVHCFNVSGSRRLIDSGEIIGPGVYVYEPAGNVDSWEAVGDEPAVILITSFGGMEYLDKNDQVLRRDTSSTLFDVYMRYCEEHKLTPVSVK
jgi:quercetin dioxygenase-like cupin family protein